MKKKAGKKLLLSRETLHRMEKERLREVAAGGGGVPCPESISYCLTDLCISDGYTGCTACEM